MQIELFMRLEVTLASCELAIANNRVRDIFGRYELLFYNDKFYIALGNDINDNFVSLIGLQTTDRTDCLGVKSLKRQYIGKSFLWTA